MIIRLKKFTETATTVKEKTIACNDKSAMDLTAEFNTEEICQKMKVWQQEFEDDPSIRNYLQLLMVQAEVEFANGNPVTAMDNLADGLDMDNLKKKYPELVDWPPFLLRFLRAAEFLVDLFIWNGRIDDALNWSKTCMEIAEKNYPDTNELIEAQVQYAACLSAAGQNENAKAMYEIARKEINCLMARLKDLEDEASGNIKWIDEN